jgi:hypothetical protein
MFVHSRHLFIAVIQRSDSFPADGSSIFSRLNDHSLAVNSGTKYQAKWIGVQTSRQSSRHVGGQGENRLHGDRRPLNAWRGSGSDYGIVHMTQLTLWPSRNAQGARQWPSAMPMAVRNAPRLWWATGTAGSTPSCLQVQYITTVSNRLPLCVL